MDKKTVKGYIVLTPNEPPWPESEPATYEKSELAVFKTFKGARREFSSFPIVPCTITYEA